MASKMSRCDFESSQISVKTHCRRRGWWYQVPPSPHPPPRPHPTPTPRHPHPRANLSWTWIYSTIFMSTYDVIDDVITMIIFSGIIWDDLLIFEVKLKLLLVFEHFQNGCHLEDVIPEFERASKIAMTISIFVYFVDSVAKILTEICQFPYATYFVTCWSHRWHHLCVKHNLQN